MVWIFFFRTFANSKWAAEELIDILLKDMSIPPLCVVERFRDEMYRLSTLNKKTEHVFCNSSYSVAEDIMDQLINN